MIQWVICNQVELDFLTRLVWLKTSRLTEELRIQCSKRRRAFCGAHLTAPTTASECYISGRSRSSFLHRATGIRRPETVTNTRNYKIEKCHKNLRNKKDTDLSFYSKNSADRSAEEFGDGFRRGGWLGETHPVERHHACNQRNSHENQSISVERSCETRQTCFNRFPSWPFINVGLGWLYLV